MAYRDDVDALFERASTLQHELDGMREKLDERDRELAKLRGTKPRRDDTSPGMRALRNAPPLEELMERLVDRGSADDTGGEARGVARDRKPRDPSPLSSYLAIDVDAPAVRTGARPPAVPPVPPTAHAQIVRGLARVPAQRLEALAAIVDALGNDVVRESFVSAFETAALVARGR
jgi:hypothetical protein|nr:hypothetical protein [Kofleriaceae bacterium]